MVVALEKYKKMCGRGCVNHTQSSLVIRQATCPIVQKLEVGTFAQYRHADALLRTPWHG